MSEPAEEERNPGTLGDYEFARRYILGFIAKLRGVARQSKVCTLGTHRHRSLWYEVQLDEQHVMCACQIAGDVGGEEPDVYGTLIPQLIKIFQEVLNKLRSFRKRKQDLKLGLFQH